MAKAKKMLGLNSSEINAGVADYSYYQQLTANRPYITGWVQNAGNIAPGSSCGTQV